MLPQKVIEDFKKKHLAAGNASQEKTIDQLRAGAQQFAAKHGLVLERRVLEALSYPELMGLGGAAVGGVDPFRASAEALKLIASATGEVPPPAAPAAGKGRGASKAAPKPEGGRAPAAQAQSEAGAGTAPSASYAQLAEQIQKATDAETAALVLDGARGALPDEQLAELSEVYRRAWAQKA